MMKKLIIIAIMAVVSLGTCEVQAQYVEKVGTKIFIDVQDMLVATWSNTTLIYDHTENSANNTLYKRFEVAKSDELVTMTWDVAKATCAQRGTGWRLPTQKELMLIKIMKDILLIAGSDPFIKSELYWSSTTNSEDNNAVWFVRVGGDGMTSTMGKVLSKPVRCVREVTN